MKSLNEIVGNLNIILPKSEKIKKTKKKIKIESENELVVQHNHLIEARYRLSLQEKRVILWLLTQIKPNDEDFKLHRLEIVEFTKMINISVDSRYSELRTITKRLIQRAIEIYDPQSHTFTQFSWLSFSKYYLKKGYVELGFDPRLKPYLLQLKSHFTKLSIVDIMQLNSIYAMRVYELLKQYEPIRKREITIVNLRKLCGITETEYERYNDLKKNVLERAKKEINEKTDIVISYKEIKESRKIVAIEWTIKKKDPNKEEKLKLASQQKEFRSKESLTEAITKYGFGRTTARQFLNNYKEEDIKNAIRAVDIQIERNHVKNPKAMLRIAIQEQWHPEIFKTSRKSN
jgi:plasmid replication initiation protein